MSQLTRQNFDGFWFDVVRKATPPAHPFTESSLAEIQNSRVRVMPALKEAIVDHHINQHRLADRLATLGFEATASFVRTELPKKDTYRKGNFGEVLASEHLRQRYGLHMPIFKLRHRDSDLPMRGEDVVAFEMSPEGEIVRVAIAEAKTRVQLTRQAITEAHERLESSYHPRPMTLSMLAEIAYEGNDADLGREIDRVADLLATTGFPRSNWIFALTQSSPKEPFACLLDGVEIVPDLHCIIALLPRLSELVNEVFSVPLPPQGDM